MLCQSATQAEDLKDPTGPCISGWGNKKDIKQRFYDICDHGVVLAVGRYLSQLILARAGPGVIKTITNHKLTYLQNCYQYQNVLSENSNGLSLSTGACDEDCNFYLI